MGRYRTMSTDDLVVQVAGHLELGNAKGGKPFHRELCRRLKDGERNSRIASTREKIRTGVVLFVPLGSTVEQPGSESSVDVAVAAYRRGGWRAFDELCSQHRAQGAELNTHDLIDAGLLDVVADKAAEAFVGNRGARKKVHEHVSFIKRHDSKSVGWLIANGFARAAHQWVELGEYALAGRLYHGAHVWARPEMVQMVFENEGLDALNLSRAHRHSLSQRPLLRAVAA